MTKLRIVFTILALTLAVSAAQAVFPWPFYSTQAEAKLTRPISAPSGPVLVQQKTGSGTDKIFVFNFDAPVTTGNLVVVCVSYLNTQSVTDVDSNSDNTVQQTASNGTGIASEIRSVIAVSAGTEVHVSTTDTTDLVVNISEWSGISSATAEAVNNGTGVLSATVATGSVTPGSTRNLIIGVGAWTADDYQSGPTNGFTRMIQVGQGATTFQESAYIIQSSATAKSTGWTLSAGVNWAAAIAAFGGN